MVVEYNERQMLLQNETVLTISSKAIKMEMKQIEVGKGK